MGKGKTVLAVLLLAALLIGGGLLPTAAVRFQDWITANAVQYENIEALQLKLEEEISGLRYEEKLLLMVSGDSVEVTAEDMRIKEQNILEATYTALTPYMELFFGGSVDNDYLEYSPGMVYDSINPTHYARYWHVMLPLDTPAYDSLAVVLDDETGKILCVEWHDPEMYNEDAYLQILQEALAGIYFEDLGIEPVAQWAVATENAEKFEARGNVLAANCYQFAIGFDRTVNVEIGVCTDGFYIYIV